MRLELFRCRDWLARSERHASIGYVCVRVKRGAMLDGVDGRVNHGRVVSRLSVRRDNQQTGGQQWVLCDVSELRSQSGAFQWLLTSQKPAEWIRNAFLTNRRSMEAYRKNGMVLSPSCVISSDKKPSSWESRSSFCLESMVKLFVSGFVDDGGSDRRVCSHCGME